jgi:hypothetical protein
LGRTEEAKANKVWFYVSLGYLGFVLLSEFIPAIPDIVFQGASIGLLLGWYFSLGKKQIQHVKDNWQDRYQRKPWRKPLLIAFGCLVCFVVALCIPTVVNEALSGLQ